VDAGSFNRQLACRDRIDSDTVNLTQEFLADMLGVQRTTVTAVAQVATQRPLAGVCPCTSDRVDVVSTKAAHTASERLRRAGVADFRSDPIMWSAPPRG